MMIDEPRRRIIPARISTNPNPACATRTSSCRGPETRKRKGASNTRSKASLALSAIPLLAHHITPRSLTLASLGFLPRPPSASLHSRRRYKSARHLHLRRKHLKPLPPLQQKIVAVLEGAAMDWADPTSLMSSAAAAAGSSSSSSSYHHLCCYGAGIAGNVFAFVLFISPLPTFRRIVRNGSTERFSSMPYIYSLLNCLICMWYGLPFVSYGVVLVATVNSIGAAFQLAYTAVFIAFAADARQRLKVSGLLAAVLAVFGLIVYVSLAWFDHKTRQLFIGYLSVASLVFMFASPLSIINLVIKTKSVEYMPFYLSLSMFLMSASFFAYGMLLHDFFIYVPNGIGTVLGVIQLLLYAYFSKRSKEEARRPLLVTHT